MNKNNARAGCDGVFARNYSVLISVMFAGVLSTFPSSAEQSEAPPDWHADKQQVDIDSDLSLERTTLALTPLPDDIDWPHYNNRIDGRRFSKLKEISIDNVDQLIEACRVKVSGTGPFSAGPVVVDGTIYTTAWRTTIAIESSNCDVIWKSIYAPEQMEVYNANRGVTFLDGKLFRGTGDARLVAYDAQTGAELWRKKIGEPEKAEYVSGAPVAWDGKVFIGLAGGDFGIVGRVMAFDAETGEQIWSFNTIPQPGEFGNDTWAGESWKSGGGGTWSSFTIDTDSGQLFVPVANPAPDFNAEVRAGDNLFTNAVVALDTDTGKRIWHYQTRKNDSHDYGLASPPVLLDFDGRAVVAQASKDGFVYLIDRSSHDLIWKQPVTTILNHDAPPTPEGVKVCPGAKGGVQYNSPAYDPDFGLLIVGSVDWCYRLRSEPLKPHVPGTPYMAGRMEHADDSGTGWITALEVQTGKIAWRYHAPAPVIAGITTSAGGLTFAGDAAGTLYIFRTSNGELLRKINTGGALAGGIITYRSQGQQQLAVNVGNVSRSSWGTASGLPSQVIYRLPGGGDSENIDPATLEPSVASGKGIFTASCSVCHGPAGVGGEASRLAGLYSEITQSEMVSKIVDPPENMPSFFPATMSAQDVADVAAYVRSLDD